MAQPHPDAPIPPGWPGIDPRWTSSAKSAVGTALGSGSRVWYTLSHGILNEVYYPRIDQACLRDLGLLVADGDTFFSEEKRDTNSIVEWIAPGAPAFRVENRCRLGRYRIVKDVIADPIRDVVLQRVRFTALEGKGSDYQVYVLAAPHLANGGSGNTAWVGDYKGVPMLFAERRGTCLALACAPDWTRGSAGFVGVSDGWQDVSAHKTMTWDYPRAEDGNVSLIGAVDLAQSGGEFVIALGFGDSPAEAAHRARASLQAGFPAALKTFLHDWTVWQAQVALPSSVDAKVSIATSLAMLRCHEEKGLPGAMIASLSIPWGASKGDDDLGGYHLVWPRDLVESAGAFLAAGKPADARRVLEYLRITQSADGSWPQNMWVSGESYWHGIQLDETAFPILLVDLLRRHRALDAAALNGFWPMVKNAARFIVQNGPASPQDRWEENSGISPFTIAVEVAGLLVAAEMAAARGEKQIANYLTETADDWNARIESHIYVVDTSLARQAGVDGYYVRIAPIDTADASSPACGFVPIKNRPWPTANTPAQDIVSPDALALVRFGLRAADDPRIVNTVRVIDAVLKVELPQGPSWRRYNGDGYGEHADGSPFDGTGIGRAWPLLIGERAHYELAAGRIDAAKSLLASLEACAGDGGLLPEQSWDDGDVPSRELFRGRPSGSAMPLAWAHGEHIKLLRSLQDGTIFDRPPQTYERYVVQRTPARVAVWRRDHACGTMAAGQVLRIETDAPFALRWSDDGDGLLHAAQSTEPGFCRYLVDLPTADCIAGTRIIFAIAGPGDAEGERHAVMVVAPDQAGTAAPARVR
jgi:glucoamylase